MTFVAFLHAEGSFIFLAIWLSLSFSCHCFKGDNQRTPAKRDHKLGRAPFLCLWNGREDAERSFLQLKLNRATSNQFAV